MQYSRFSENLSVLNKTSQYPGPRWKSIQGELENQHHSYVNLFRSQYSQCRHLTEKKKPRSPVLVKTDFGSLGFRLHAQALKIEKLKNHAMLLSAFAWKLA